MADVKNGNQILHFSDNLKYSEHLGMWTYSRFFKEVSQLKYSIEYCTWKSYSNSSLPMYFLIPFTFLGNISHPFSCYMYTLATHCHPRCYFSLSFSLLLLWSDIRSEGIIAIVKKFDFDFLWFLILHYSHSLKMCFRRNVRVCVCVCVSVSLSDRHRS